MIIMVLCGLFETIKQQRCFVFGQQEGGLLVFACVTYMGINKLWLNNGTLSLFLIEAEACLTVWVIKVHIVTLYLCLKLNFRSTIV